MSDLLNTDIEGVNTKIENLWKEYSGLFNEYNPLIEDIQRDKMEFLLSEIRAWEKKRDSIHESISA